MSDTFTVRAILKKYVKIATFFNFMPSTEIVLTQRGDFAEVFLCNFCHAKTNEQKKLSYHRSHIGEVN